MSEQEIRRNLERAIKGVERDLAKGLMKAGLFLQGEAQEITPQEFGPLVNSAFTDVDRDALVARVGFTAEYAPFVHEMPETYNYTKPDTGPKFLEKPAMQKQGQILAIMKKSSEIR